MITEIGDIKRFKHPRQLVSWMGIDIREYSSGGKNNRFRITKHTSVSNENKFWIDFLNKSDIFSKSDLYFIICTSL
jgi:hypothetical protein